jgi:hypothetical protein
MALTGQMINLGGLHLGKNPSQGSPVRKVAVMEKKTFIVDLFIAPEMLDARTEKVARSPNDSMNRIALSQKQLREVGTILPRDPGNEGGLWVLLHRSDFVQPSIHECLPPHKDEQARLSSGHFVATLRRLP